MQHPSPPGASSSARQELSNAGSWTFQLRLTGRFACAASHAFRRPSRCKKAVPSQEGIYISQHSRSTAAPVRDDDPRRRRDVSHRSGVRGTNPRQAHGVGILLPHCTRRCGTSSIRLRGTVLLLLQGELTFGSLMYPTAAVSRTLIFCTRILDQIRSEIYTQICR